MSQFLRHLFSHKDKNQFIRNTHQADTLKVFLKRHYHKVAFLHELENYKKLMDARSQDPKLDWFPQLLWHDDNSIMALQYVGEPICADNIPDNWEEQVDKVLQSMKSVGVEHHDLVTYDHNRREWLTEFMVLEGKVYLVDFGHRGDTKATDDNIRQAKQILRDLWALNKKKQFSSCVGDQHL